MSVTVTLSQSQIEKLLAIIEEAERGLLEARTILTMNPRATLIFPIANNHHIH